VAYAGNAGSDVPDPDLMPCFTIGAYGLQFPPLPEDAVVVLRYDLHAMPLRQAP